MADEAVQNNETPASRVIRLLSARPPQPCNVCNSQVWAVAYSQVTPPVTTVIEILEVNSRKSLGFNDFTGLMCMTCGHMLLQHAGVFAAYIDRLELLEKSKNE